MKNMNKKMSVDVPALGLGTAAASAGLRRFVGVAALGLIFSSAVYGATFNPATGSWTTGSSWSTGTAPGTSGATDNVGTIGSGKTATLDNSGNLITQQFRPDLQPGGTLTVTGAGNTMSFDQPGIFGTLNMNGGSVSVLNGGQRARLYLRQNFDSVINMNAGTWSDSAYINLNVFGAPSASQPATATININGGTFATSLTSVGTTTGDYMTSALNINGSDATISLSNMTWALPTTNTNGASTINFALANDGSVSTVAVANTLNLGDGSTRLQSDLSVNLSAYAYQGQTTNIDLFSYGSLSTTFGSVDVYTMDGSTKVSLNPSQYSLDYGTGTSDTISLTVIPEPSTFVLFGLAGVAMVLGLRRKRA